MFFHHKSDQSGPILSICITFLIHGPHFHFIFCFSACMIHERATSPESHVTCPFRLWLPSLLLRLCLPSFFSDVPSPSASPTVYHGYGSAPRVPLNLYLSVRPLPPTILNSNASASVNRRHNGALTLPTPPPRSTTGSLSRSHNMRSPLLI
jgi:hypothetical protein